MHVVQSWVFEHFKTLRSEESSQQVDAGTPRATRSIHPGKWENPNSNLAYYRHELDLLELERVLWNPYTKEKDCGAEQVHQRALDWEALETALCRTYVIFDNIAEQYLPDRVLGQFGMRQPIPANPGRWDKFER
ncbi:hypothetical protein AMTRI_Chr06g194250 [Amborella trichopoda]